MTATDPAFAFRGYAHQAPDGITGQFDIHEPQIFLTESDECDGGVSSRDIIMDLYAFALDGGAVPGSYPLTNSLPDNSPPFATFNVGYFSIVSGTLTLSQVDSAATIGSFDAHGTAVDGGAVEIQGTFTAPFCGGDH